MASEQPKQWPTLERRSAQRGDLVEPPRRRRLRDRLQGEEEVLRSPALDRQADLRNPLLNCDDDLRQTARALEDIEAFLVSTLRLLEKQDLTRADVMALLADDVDGRIDNLSETMTSLRKSLGQIADRL